MKKIILFFTLAMLMLCSCGKQGKTDFCQNNDAISENIQIDINAEDRRTILDMEESDNDDSIPIMQAFQSVLLFDI